MKEYTIGVLERFYWSNTSHYEREKVLTRIDEWITIYENNYGDKMFFLEKDRSAGMCTFTSLFGVFEDYANKDVHESD